MHVGLTRYEGELFWVNYPVSSKSHKDPGPEWMGAMKKKKKKVCLKIIPICCSDL